MFCSFIKTRKYLKFCLTRVVDSCFKIQFWICPPRIFPPDAPHPLHRNAFEREIMRPRWNTYLSVQDPYTRWASCLHFDKTTFHVRCDLKTNLQCSLALEARPARRLRNSRSFSAKQCPSMADCHCVFGTSFIYFLFVCPQLKGGHHRVRRHQPHQPWCCIKRWMGHTSDSVLLDRRCWHILGSLDLRGNLNGKNVTNNIMNMASVGNSVGIAGSGPVPCLRIGEQATFHT